MYPPGASTLREAFTLRVGMCSYFGMIKNSGPVMYLPGFCIPRVGIYFPGMYVLLFGMT